MTRCTSCERPQILGTCPGCTPDAYLDAMFALEVTPGQFISPRHYGGWMRRKPVRTTKTRRGGIKRVWRESLFRNDKYACVHCGSDCNLTFGHVVPWIFGGKDEPCNGRTECGTCNGRQWTPELAAMVEDATCRRDGTHPKWARDLAYYGYPDEDIDVDTIWNPVLD